MSLSEVRDWLARLPYKITEKDPDTGVNVVRWSVCKNDEQRIEVIEEMLNNAWTDEMTEGDRDVCLTALSLMNHVYVPVQPTKYDKTSEIKSRESLVKRQQELKREVV